MEHSAVAQLRVAADDGAADEVSTFTKGERAAPAPYAATLRFSVPSRRSFFLLPVRADILLSTSFIPLFAETPSGLFFHSDCQRNAASGS